MIRKAVNIPNSDIPNVTQIPESVLLKNNLTIKD